MDIIMENWFKLTYRHFGSFWGWNNPSLAPVKKKKISNYNESLKAIIGVV